MTKRYFQYYPIWFAFFILIISCNKSIIGEYPIGGEDTSAECYFPPPNGGGFGWGYDDIFDSVRFTTPYFNPNNPDEFIYLENRDLYKYKISTEEKTLLYSPDSYIYYQPKWSRKGKIAFNTSDYNIYVINENGDSLTKITNVSGDATSNFYGEFNYTGDSLMFATNSNFSDGTTQKTRIAYNNFSQIDTIKYVYDSPTCNWQKPGYLLNVFYTAVFSFSIQNPENIQYFELDTISNGGVIWLSNKIDFYCYLADGVYFGNFETNFFTKVKDMCPTIFYIYPCYSEISEKVITTKVSRIYLGNNKVYSKFEIILMNPDGSGEQVILPKPN